MGTPTLTLCGLPPRRGSGALRHWIRYEVPAARIAEIDLPRTTTYHFSNAGNDTTGDGSIGNPWATVAKANTVIAAAATNADMRLRWARGGVWAEAGAAAGLNISGKNNITLDAYGTGDAPLFHRFTSIFASGWTLDTGDCYYRSVAERPGWIRQTIARLSPYSHQTTIAAVRSTPRSWTYDSGTGRVYLNAGAGINPNSPSLAYELSFASTTDDDGLFIQNADGIVVRGLRFDGWGCSATDSRQKYGIRVELTGNQAVWLDDCEVEYSGRHAIGLLGQGTSSGGILFATRCRAGYHYDGGAGVGSNNFVAYHSDADFECLMYDCESRFGILPHGSTYVEGSLYEAQDVICHAGGTNKARLVIISGGGPTWSPKLVNWTLSSGAVGVATEHAPGTEGQPDTYRCFIDRYGPRHYRDARWDFAPKNQYLDCEYRVRYPSNSTDSFPQVAVGVAGGLVEGGVWDLQDDRDATDRWLLPASASNTTEFDGTTFAVEGYTVSGGGTRWRMGQASASVAMPGVTLRNCIFSRRGDRTFYIGIGNFAAQILSCAHYGVQLSGTDGIDQGTGLVQLASAWSGGCAPPSPIGSDLEEAAAASLLTIDILGRTRPRFASIGPVEARPAQMELATILDRIGPIAGSGNNTLFGFLRAIVNSAAGFAASELAAVSDGGDYDNTAASIAAFSNSFALAFLWSSGGGMNSATSTTVTLSSPEPAIADYYSGAVILLAGGTGAGQARRIDSYSAGRVVTIDRAWSTNPDGTTFYIILKGAPAPISSTDKSSIATTLLDLAAGVETNLTIRQAMRLFVSALANKVAGGGTNTVSFRDYNDTKNRITATVDGFGNRSAITRDVT